MSGSLPGIALMPGSGTPVTTGTPPTGGTIHPAPGPPAVAAVPGFALSDQAKVKLGLSLTKEVTKWFLTPLDQPTMNLSPDAQAAWGDYKLGEQADYTSWVSEQTPPVVPEDAVIVENDAVMTAVDTGEGLTGDAAAAVTSGTVEAAPIAADGMASLTVALQGLGIAAALTDMGFAIAGKLPDAEKAVIATLDAAIIGAMFIPVYGWAVGLVLGIVRGILGLVGTSLFGAPDLSHAQREALEVARTASQGLNPWMQEVAADMTPRELIRTIIRWGSGYCGGTSSVAISVALYNTAGDFFGPGTPGCYWNVGHHYHEWADTAAMTLDQQALALAKYGSVEAHVAVQAGVAQHYLDDMNTAGLALLKARLAAWGELLAKGATLDDLDALAFEQRQTPQWNAVAAFFGEASWHALVGWHLQDLWTRYLVTSRSGSLADFAAKRGYPSWLALRDAVMVPYDRVRTDVLALDAQLGVYDGASVRTLALPSPGTPQLALTARLAALDSRLATLEVGCVPWQTAQAAAAQAAADSIPAYVLTPFDAP